MSQRVGRRNFMRQASALGAALGTGLVATAQDLARPGQDRVVVGIMGLSRGQGLAQTFAAQENVEVRYLCDVDRQRAGSCQQALRAPRLLRRPGSGRLSSHPG